MEIIVNQSEIITVLVNLGLHRKEAERRVASFANSICDDNDLIRACLLNQKPICRSPQKRQIPPEYKHVEHDRQFLPDHKFIRIYTKNAKAWAKLIKEFNAADISPDEIKRTFQGRLNLITTLERIRP